ncbi:MAG: hypothetical protein WDN25_13450 [Acetobacteraceae bacterium]
MRTYGRVTDTMGNKTWVEVTTDAQGFNDMVYVTTLAQTLKLNLGDSPFYADYGIPAHPSIVQQVIPDFYVARTQQQFAARFASLQIARVSGDPPTYNLTITTHQGVRLNASVPIPT